MLDKCALSSDISQWGLTLPHHSRQLLFLNSTQRLTENNFHFKARKNCFTRFSNAAALPNTPAFFISFFLEVTWRTFIHVSEINISQSSCMQANWKMRQKRKIRWQFQSTFIYTVPKASQSFFVLSEENLAELNTPEQQEATVARKNCPLGKKIWSKSRLQCQKSSDLWPVGIKRK